jgi:phosphate transport system protein
MAQHRLLDRELDALRDRMSLLAGKTEAALQNAMQALANRDSQLAQEVIAGDDEIDILCVDTIVLKQPAARDLRYVIAVSKATTILERIADHATNIARDAVILNDEPQLKHYIDLPRMAGIASGMLRTALDAFIAGDALKAREVIARDADLDKMYGRIFRYLLDIMIDDPETIRSAARLLFVAKHIERIGDYVTDICELVVYMAEAAVIKHSKE